MRIFCCLFLLIPAIPVWGAIDPEPKVAYQYRIVLRTSDHPTLTPYFRGDFSKQLRQIMQNALGAFANVEVVDLANVPAEKRDPLWQLVDEKGLEALDAVNTVNNLKTQFVFVDIVNGQYEVRLRQHDGYTGIATPLIRTVIQAERSLLSRSVTRVMGEDLGFIGTVDPNNLNTLTLKGGDLGAPEPWVKKGDVFALVQVRENRRPTRPAKGKDGKPMVTAVSTGQRLDGMLLQVQETPKSSVVPCKFYSRFKAGLPRDGTTVGYRAIKLGTSETIVKLSLTDMAGNPVKSDSIRVRVGEHDFPVDTSREREEMTLVDGVFTSKDPRSNLAFILVTSNDVPVARIPLELYRNQIAVRKINLDPRADALNDATDRVRDMIDRVRSARVVLARAFDELSEIQRKDKPQALRYGETAFNTTQTEANALRADLDRLKTRLGKEAPAGSFEPAEADLRALEAKNNELKAHLGRLKDAIRVENDPKTMAKRKAIDGLILDAKLLVQKADYPQAMEKYQEAITLAQDEPAAKAELEKSLAQLQQEWQIKDPDHATARKFIYDVWPKWEKPSEMRDGLAELKKSVAKCQTVGDRVTLLKCYLTGPQVLEKFAENLKSLADAATEDEDKKALAEYPKVGDELQKIMSDVAKALGVDKK